MEKTYINICTNKIQEEDNIIHNIYTTSYKKTKQYCDIALHRAVLQQTININNNKQ